MPASSQDQKPGSNATRRRDRPLVRAIPHKSLPELFCVLDHLVGLLDRVLNSQVTGTKPLQVQMDQARKQALAEMGGQTTFFVLADRLEVQMANDEEVLLWDGQGWIGGGRDKFWFKTEGEFVFRLDPRGKVAFIVQESSGIDFKPLGHETLNVDHGMDKIIGLGIVANTDLDIKIGSDRMRPETLEFGLLQLVFGFGF